MIVEQDTGRRTAVMGPSRQQVRGAGVGVMLLGIGGGLWAALGLAGIPGGQPWAGLMVVAVAAAFVAVGAWVAARADRLPRVEPGLRELWPNVAIIPSSLALGAALFGDALARAQHQTLLPLVIMLLVGFHFLPLARVLGLALYHQTGLWLVALALCTWAFVPQILATGALTLALWPLVSGLGGAAILWATACWSLSRLLPLLRTVRA